MIDESKNPTLKVTKVASVGTPETPPEINAAKPLATRAPARNAKLICPCRKKLRTDTIATKMLVAEIKTALRTSLRYGGLYANLILLPKTSKIKIAIIKATTIIKPE
jgi:hypothetical protein